MSHFIRSVLALLFLAAALPANAAIKVLATTSDWGALTTELGGDQVNVYTATSALQDVHRVDAKPSLVARARTADLVVATGAELEIGWLPVLIQESGNRRIQPGNPGYFEASLFVQRLEATSGVDRAQGDIHPQGNPHVQTNPHNVSLIGRALAERMAELDPDNSAAYQNGFADFKARFDKAIAEWEARAAPLKGKRVITHHKSWVYMERWLGLQEVANLEPIPGLPPTAGHLSQLVSRFNDGGADVIIRSPYQDARASEWLMERTGIPAVVLPLTVGGTEKATDLFSLYSDSIDRLLEATR